MRDREYLLDEIIELLDDFRKEIVVREHGAVVLATLANDLYNSIICNLDEVEDLEKLKGG